MRIVGGEFRGRALIAPGGRDTRPTSDRAREAIFNVIAHAGFGTQIEDARVIDLFAGSGALGFEALSRGAVQALFVETDEQARGAIRDNAEALGLFGRARVHRRSATDLGPRPGPIGDAFDLAFLDPPYGRSLGAPALAALRDGLWLKPGALVVLEEGRDDPLTEVPGFEPLDVRSWGAARVSFMSRTGDDTAP